MHATARAALEECQKEHVKLCTATHTYAELYSNLTRLPFDLNLPPAQATQAIITQLKHVLTFVPLTDADYQAALARCAERNLVSGVIYDALHLQAAIRADAEVLYTANLRDFERLGARDVLELRGG